MGAMGQLSKRKLERPGLVVGDLKRVQGSGALSALGDVRSRDNSVMGYLNHFI